MNDLAGKTCVVTGASSGIGLETARGLAALGARVALAGRDPVRTREVEKAIRAETGNGDIHAFVADFSSLAAVRGLAQEIRDRYPALDVLVNNAGLWHPRPATSADGFEDTLAVNHLAPYLLTRLLLDALKRGAPARIVNVSSILHRKEEAPDFDYLTGRTRYSGLRAYRQTKLANILFTRELARRLDGTGVIAHSLHPGDVATRVVRESALARLYVRIIARWVLTPAEGARTSLHVATAPELGGVTGRYFEKCREVEPGSAAQDDEAAGRLWEASEAMVGAIG
ncbi:MAG: SDR family oxidoreductase [Myxococcales bacterium]|nr:SDR family oxidoreductase [Myxococcales bacterium]